MNKPDCRTRTGRDQEVMAELSIRPNGLPVEWIEGNRNRPAAIERLIAANKIRRLPVKHPSVLRFAVASESRSVFRRVLAMVGLV